LHSTAKLFPNFQAFIDFAAEKTTGTQLHKLKYNRAAAKTPYLS